MTMKSFLAAAALLLVSSEAAVLDSRQWSGGRGSGSDCASGNDAIDSLIQSSAIMQALCASVVPQQTKTVSVTSSTQVTVLATVTDTIISPVGGSTRTVYVTTTGTTTRTVRVTQTGQSSAPASASPLPTAPSPSAPAPTTSDVPAPISTPAAPPAPPAPTSTPLPPAPPVSTVPSCDAVGYAGSSPSYYFDGSGANANFANCSALCRADAKCASFGYGSGACLLFNVTDTNNVNLVAGAPYRFFNRDCPAPVVSRDWSQIYGRQFGGGGTWGSTTGSTGSGSGVIQQLTDVCKCLYGNSAAVTITKSIVNAATVTSRTRLTVTVPTTVPVTLTATRRTINTVTAYSTVFVQPGATDVPPGTYDGGVGR